MKHKNLFFKEEENGFLVFIALVMFFVFMYVLMITLKSCGF